MRQSQAKCDERKCRRVKADWEADIATASGAMGDRIVFVVVVGKPAEDVIGQGCTAITVAVGVIVGVVDGSDIVTVVRFVDLAVGVAGFEFDGKGFDNVG